MPTFHVVACSVVKPHLASDNIKGVMETAYMRCGAL